MTNAANWRRQCVALLAADPCDWIRLSELFAQVERSIPIHTAVRSQACKCGTEIGLHTARWRLFLQHVGPLTERRSADGASLSYRRQRTDFVRLRPDDTACGECGGPRFLQAWPQRGEIRKYFCVRCIDTPTARIAETSPAPAPERPIVASKMQICIDMGRAGPAIRFGSWRVLARYVRALFGQGSLNQVEREIQRRAVGSAIRREDLERLLQRRGKTLRQFFDRLQFHLQMSMRQNE